MDLSMVIPPRNPEDNDPFWLHDALQYVTVEIHGVCLKVVPQGSYHFMYGLVKLMFPRVLRDHVAHKVI